MSDINVEEVWRVREELIKSFGGIDGYFQHCQAQDRVAATPRKPKKRKQPLAVSHKSVKPKKAV
jgi:hypothetical protein